MRAIRLSLIGLLLWTVSGCASPPPSRLVLTISNQSGRGITAVHQKDCEAGELELEPREDSEIRSGQTRRFVMPPSCVDLVAYDARGRVVGEQRAMTVIQGARWELRR
ncbi:MAG: hypothetical protein AB8G23_24160 [Myxococcota bacterium]